MSLVLFVLLHSVLAADPAHLKPGVLSAHLGRVSLIEDVLWVRYKFTTLVDMPDRLRALMDQVTELVLQLERNAPKDGVTRVMHEPLRYLNETLDIAVENYADHSFSNRTKRGLINGLGQLSCMLFGTAMDEDMEDIRERYNHLVSLAANQNKAINMKSLHINRLEHASCFLLQNREDCLNAMIEDVKSIHEMALINQALPVLESAINSVLHINNLVIKNVEDADRGRVTSSLFPVKDLQRVLMKGEKEHQLTPLFAAHAIHHYSLTRISSPLWLGH